MLLLDTHAWIWFLQGNESIKKSVVQSIEEAIQKRVIYLAAISQWEAAMLIQKNRLVLNEPPLQWMQNALEQLHLKVLPLDFETAIESTQLPGDFHGDPADRQIVATARIHHLTILTRDKKILEYSHAKHVKAITV